VSQFLWGALAATCLFVGLFFLRFWNASRDRLFLAFAAGFWALGLHWVGFSIADSRTQPYYLLLRLLAFAIIIAGVIDKNRSAKRG
jgi:hypothetical protein